ncbi:hypothetical protein GCM10020218_052790 [Dactylosporangium vinaceum]
MHSDGVGGVDGGGCMVTLVGDGIENPANVQALLEAAAMFGVPCAFRDRSVQLAPPVIAVDNAPGAESVYRTGKVHSGASVVVGNERRGIRPDLLRAAARTVHIPMPGRGVNTLNVATAAAVALYYLCGAAGRRAARGSRPESHRPAVLLAGPRDHVEAGSSLRSAAAFGWSTVAVADRERVWFDTARPVRAEGRAAARSHRNPLRVLRSEGVGSQHTRIVICSSDSGAGPPIHRVDLTGAGTLIVVPDGDWAPPPGLPVEYVQVPGPSRYRLVSGVVLAEVARQLGPRPDGSAGRPPRRGPAYRSELRLVTEAEGELLEPWELLHY